MDACLHLVLCLGIMVGRWGDLCFQNKDLTRGAQEQDKGQDGGPILATQNPADIYRVLPPIPKMTLQPRKKCLTLKEYSLRMGKPEDKKLD